MSSSTTSRWPDIAAAISAVLPTCPLHAARHIAGGHNTCPHSPHRHPPAQRNGSERPARGPGWLGLARHLAQDAKARVRPPCAAPPPHRIRRCAAPTSAPCSRPDRSMRRRVEGGATIVVTSSVCVGSVAMEWEGAWRIPSQSRKLFAWR